jgi:peptide/nickel transport system permease protein
MQRFIIRRLVYTLFALVGATVMVFGLSRLQGDPRYLYIQEGGYGMTQETWDAVGKRLGLDKPLVVQYGIWLGNAARGDLGESLLEREPVLDRILARAEPTLRLGLVSWVLATAIGIPLGVISAVHRATAWDYLARGFALVGQAAPPFFVGIMGILLFAVYLRVLPSGTIGEGFSIKHLILPSATLGWLAAAGYMRITRSAMLEVLDSEFIKLARAKGVANWSVIWKHAFRNALIPPLTVSSLILAGFITGTVVVETVFSWPGLGRLSIDAVNNNDFPTVTGTVLIFVLIYLGLNLATDLVYAYIDPRIRYD